MSQNVRQPLLERVLNGGQSNTSSYDDYIIQIGENLSKLLNSKQGSSEISEKYGMPDFNSVVHNCPQAVITMEKMITETIGYFEPRLKDTRVLGKIDKEHSGTLSFDIKANVVYENSKRPIAYKTVFVGNGKMMVKR
jgi:type VI secretion system protein